MVKFRLEKLLEFYGSEMIEVKQRKQAKSSEKGRDDLENMYRNMGVDFEELNKEISKEKKNNSLTKIFNSTKARQKKCRGLIFNVNKYSLNKSQKRAVRLALKSDFLCVEGPPGNGKSEMITGLLVNAVLRDQKVLIASHNNEAVDAVNRKLERMNIPNLFIRSGNREHRDQNTKKYAEQLKRPGFIFYSFWKALAYPFFFSPFVHKQLLKSKLKKDIKKYEQYIDKTKEVAGENKTKKLINDYLFHYCSGWGVTNMSVASNFHLESGMFDLLVIDEAAQCEIGPVLPLMYRAKKVVAVGDPNQLKPIKDVLAEKERKDYIVSFKDLTEEEKDLILKSESFFDLVRYKTAGKTTLLDEHYRCHPEIIGYNNEIFYKNKLIIKTEPKKEKTLGIFWIHSRLTEPSNELHINNEEIRLTRLAIERINKDYGVDYNNIGVIAPFRKHFQKMEKQISNLSPQIKMGTIHQFQGGEQDYIIINLCLHKAMKEGTKNWEDRERSMVNVATSRAKKGLIIIGDYHEAHRRQAFIKKLADYYDKTGKKIYNRDF